MTRIMREGQGVYVIGVDGCPGGWLAVRYEVHQPSLDYRVHPSFPELLHAYPDAEAIGVDIPIGLVENEARRCDKSARKLLGPKKGPAVFPAPDPRLMPSDPTYDAAKARAELFTGKKISRQTYAI